MKPTLQTILDLFAQRGSQMYGLEAVSQLEHALQCATLAEAEGQNPEAIAACLLHDLGHLIHEFGDDAAKRGIDDRHEHRALPLLQQLFGAAITEPIRLHVDAKRYLCTADPDYWSTLSRASQVSLELQGGALSSEEASQFIDRPYAREAVRLRWLDDRAKIVGLDTPDLAHFIPVLQRCI
ncbi:phosphonate degradation HD-domain oxygenase [Pseudanabaena sp. PCC 6802]|uniref:phosphonate degradation HD-domain oxygenase n=1 Tax=Pseudanabaena sp. PCC 6802 TaxID=118173 RepID=UPI0003486E7D|nr:phosphonate degradation HD-domain oxygenase [Pseudanabaena sp. PCC 6802]